MEQQILNAARKAVYEGIIDSLVGYNKPLSKLCAVVVEDNSDALYELINTEFQSLLNGEGFKETLRYALNKKLSSVLINRMGGELERRVDELKRNPETRAKITLAISKIIDEM